MEFRKTGRGVVTRVSGEKCARVSFSSAGEISFRENFNYFLGIHYSMLIDTCSVRPSFFSSFFNFLKFPGIWILLVTCQLFAGALCYFADTDLQAPVGGLASCLPICERRDESGVRIALSNKEEQTRNNECDVWRYVVYIKWWTPLSFFGCFTLFHSLVRF